MPENSREKFFSSVRQAMAEGLNREDLIGIALIIGITLGLSLSLIWVLKNRVELRRELSFFSRLLLGKVNWLDRRRNVKYPVSILIPYSPKPLERHLTVNLSRGGMFIKTPSPNELNTSFEFILKLSAHTEIKGLAMVRWVRKSVDENHPNGMGCEFVNLSKADLNKIRLYLSRKKTRTYSP